MTWGYVAVAAATVVGGAISADSSRSAANTAADAQSNAANQGISEQQRQFTALQKLLAPYNTAATGADGTGGSLNAQKDLAGLNGNGAQQSAIDALKASPQFTSALDLGNRSILANASATGGLRGGNTQAALGQFSPALLAQTINDQYSRLGGITSIGQNAAAMQGNGGMQTGQGVSALLAQLGQAQAGGALANGRATNQFVNSLTGAFGQYVGSGGMGTSRPQSANTGIGVPTDPTGNGWF